MQPPYGQGPPGNVPPQGWGQQPPPYGQAPYRTPGGAPLPSGAQLVYIMTALTFFAGALMAPVGWYLAKEELRKIDAGLADPTPRSGVQMCKTVNLVMMVLLGVALVGFVLLMVLSIGLPILLGATAG